MSYRNNSSFIVAVTGACGGLLSPTAGQQVKPACNDDTRACMITAAKSYLDAMVVDDTSNVPFAPDVKRTEQGRVTEIGEQVLRASTKLQPDMTEHANTRYFVDEDTNNVIAYPLPRIPGTKADPNRKLIRTALRLKPALSTWRSASKSKKE